MALPSGRHFAKALEDAGIISDLARVERIVIDVRPDDVVHVHVQRIGDKRLIDLAAMLTDAKVVTGD